MDFTKLAQIKLVKGAGGGDPRDGLCIMEMVSYFDGAERVSDHPACACPALTEYAIRLNDTAPSQKLRDTLKLLLPLLTGSRDDAAVAARVRHLVFATARRIVAPLFEPEHARALRGAQSYEELNTAAARAAYTAAAATAAAARAARAAAAAATAAAADDAAAATAAAYAAVYADDVAKVRIWTEAREILTEAIRLGAHGGLDMNAPTTEARAEQLLALVGAK